MSEPRPVAAPELISSSAMVTQLGPEINPSALAVVQRLQSAGHEAYFVGGCVRDRLLGQEAKDFDIATSAVPDQVLTLFPRVVDLTGKSSGVVQILKGDQAFEVATFRVDGAYKDGRRPDQVRFATAQEDAHRRDFTVNGLFYDPVRHRLIDFVGGEADLRAKVLRAIGRAEDRFAEDHLRLLRAIRFAARLEFSIELKTWNALTAGAPLIRSISAERIREELNRIVTAHRPVLGLDLLDKSGLLQEILPDIAFLHGVEQPPQFHPEGDVYVHTRLMLSNVRNPTLELALGILFHDVGKRPTSTMEDSGRIRFNNHETVGAEMTEQIMTSLRYDNKTIHVVRELVQYHMQFKDVQRMREATLKKMMQRPTFDLELELHRLDCKCSHGDLENYRYLKQRLETMEPDEINPTPLINGRDLLAMGLPPGRAVGVILEAVTTAQLENTVQTREEALNLARRMAGEL